VSIFMCLATYSLKRGGSRGAAARAAADAARKPLVDEAALVQAR